MTSSPVLRRARFPRPGRRAAVVLAAVLLVSVGTGVPAQAGPAVDPDPATVNVDDVAKQMFDEINRLRTNPAELAQRLTTMRETRTTADNGLVRVTFPDSTTGTLDLDYLATGITRAQGLAPMGALVWSDGLAKAARDYAATNPVDHGDFDGRMKAAGAGEGASESIDFGAVTGLKGAYRLYVDSRQPELGHRNMMINRALTHAGVGCFRLNRSGSVTCVVDASTDWVDQTDMAKLDSGRQFAYRDPAGGTFRYFTISEIFRGGSVELALCPEPSKGWITISSTARLTSPQAARAVGLTPSNQPCDKPDGVLQNGTPLPTVRSAGGTGSTAVKTSAAAAATSAATATTSASSTQQVSKPISAGTPAPVVFQVGRQYAYLGHPGAFTYFKVAEIRNGGSQIALLFCPRLDPKLTFSVPGPTNPKLITIPDARSRGLTPNTEPCDTKSVPNG